MFPGTTPSAWACAAISCLAVACATADSREQKGAPLLLDAASDAADGCEQLAPRIELSADRSGGVPAGTAVHYTLRLTNQDHGSCPPETFIASVTLPAGQPTFSAAPSSATSLPLAAGESAEVMLVVSSGSDEEPAEYELGFFVRSAAVSGAAKIVTARAESSYTVAEPSGCFVAPSRGLLVRHPSVVDDRERTTGRGAWTLGGLLEQLTSAAPDVLESMLRSYMTEQMINGFRVAARPLIDKLVLEQWPRDAHGKLDLARTPARLLAIVHRLDLSDLDAGRAGEGRFVFDLLTPNGDPLLFTVILEYALPAHTPEEQQAWAQRVFALQSERFPSPAYNAALEVLTDRYTAHGALLRIRTNENALDPTGQWEMREFRVADEGTLAPAPLQQTPHIAWNNTASLARYIDSNSQTILSGRYDVPEQLDGAPFQAGSVINRLDFWSADGIHDDDARHTFSLNTCDGCHGRESFTSFFHISPRSAGQPSQLSSFLTGVSDRDPVTRAERSYHELARRGQQLRAAVCPP